MPLFRRIADILSANLNEMIDRFEDPETMLKQAVREMEQAVTAALESGVRVVAHEKLLARQLADDRSQVDVWRERARQAVRAGDDDLARRAISRQLEQEQLVGALEDQHAAACETSTRLRRQIDGLRVKLTEAKRKLVTLAARQRVADARGLLRTGLLPGSRLAAASRFSRVFAQVELAEAEADALSELVGEDDEDLFEKNAGAVERELMALKAHAGS